MRSTGAGTHSGLHSPMKNTTLHLDMKTSGSEARRVETETLFDWWCPGLNEELSVSPAN